MALASIFDRVRVKRRRHRAAFAIAFLRVLGPELVDVGIEIDIEIDIDRRAIAVAFSF